MITFTHKDIEALLNDSPLVTDNGFSVNKHVVRLHPKSEEIVLTGKDEKGNEFTIVYAKKQDVKPNHESLLSSGQKGYQVDNGKEDTFKQLSERDKLVDKYNEQKNKIKEGFSKIVSPEEIKYFLKAEKGITSIAAFKIMELEYFKVCIKYGLDVHELREFIMDFRDSMKKFKPSEEYVFDSILTKLNKKAK